MIKARWRAMPPALRAAVVALVIVFGVILLGTKHDQPQCYTTVHDPATGQTHTFITPQNQGECSP